MALQYPVESVVGRGVVEGICTGIYPLVEYEGSNTGKKGSTQGWEPENRQREPDFCQLLSLQTARRPTL